MARLLRRYVRRKRRRAVLHITSLPVKSRKLSEQINDVNIHKLRAARTTVSFTRSHQTRTQPALLSRRIDRQQAQIGTFTTRFDVNTTAHNLTFARDHKRAARKRFLHFREGDPIAVIEKLLRDAKRGIDHGGYLLRVSRRRDTNFGNL